MSELLAAVSGAAGTLAVTYLLQVVGHVEDVLLLAAEQRVD